MRERSVDRPVPPIPRNAAAMILFFLAFPCNASWRPESLVIE